MVLSSIIFSTLLVSLNVDSQNSFDQADGVDSWGMSDVQCAVSSCISNCKDNPGSLSCRWLSLFCDNGDYDDPSYPYTSYGKCRAEGCRRANNPDHEPTDPGRCPEPSTQPADDLQQYDDGLR